MEILGKLCKSKIWPALIKYRHKRYIRFYMNKNLKFILFFTLFFAGLSLAAVPIFDDAHSMEMFSYVLFGDIIYLLVAAISWLIINLLTATIGNKPVQYLARFLSGLLVINVLTFFTYAKPITIDLFAWLDGRIGVDLAIHVIYTVAFLLASLVAFRTELKTGAK